MRVEEKIRELTARLTPVLGVREARGAVRVAAEDLFGWTPTELAIRAADEISGFRAGELDRVANRLLAGEPLQYILGKARFFGMTFEVTPDVLIPRPETAELADMVILENQRVDLRVLDVGTGSGVLAVALSRNLPFSRVTAIDISAGALEVARRNALRLKARIDFVQADIFGWTPPAHSFDIIVSNPPYIARSERAGMEARVAEHEPGMALFVPDSDPLMFYRRIATVGQEALAPGGKLYFEINPRFAGELGEMLTAGGYKDVKLMRDIHRRLRFAVARTPAKDEK